MLPLRGFHAVTVAVVLFGVRVLVLGATPLSPVFTYQGSISLDGAVVDNPAPGCTLAFRLMDAPVGGNQLGVTQELTNVPIVNGLFTVELNGGGEFGPDAFNGAARWLEISVACPSGSVLTLLAPRQEVTASPYALHALSAAPGNALDASDGNPLNAVFVDASGNVGVGTTSPETLLDVAGASRVMTLKITGGGPLAGAAVAWGSSSDGQLTVPTGPFTAIAAGGRHALAIRPDGTLVGWGRNVDGEINVPSGTFKAVAAGGRFSLGLRTDGTLAAWGASDAGVLNVPSGTFKAIGAGSGHGLAIRTDGTLAGWGANVQGQTNVPTGTFTAVDGGNIHSVGLRTDGTLAAWGTNTNGQLNVPAGTYVGISAGALHNLALRADGTAVGWGSNTSGEATPPASLFKAISAGAAYSLGVRTDGTLAGWGFSSDGQTVVPTGNTYTAVSAGATFGTAIEVDPNTANFGLLLAQDSAAKPGTNTWTIFSDRRLKKNITPLTGALEKLLALSGVRFEWQDAALAGGHPGPQMGLVADEVQQVFPEWVGMGPNGYKTLTIGGFEALTAEAIRQLRAEKDAEIAAQQAQIANLTARLEHLEHVLQQAGVQGK